MTVLITGAAGLIAAHGEQAANDPVARLVGGEMAAS